MDLLIVQSAFDHSRDHLIDLQRYVAIVPHRTAALESGTLLLVVNSLLNAAVLLFWFWAAAVFTVVRMAMKRLAPKVGAKRRSSGFFHSFAGVLGQSTETAGDSSPWKGESFLTFVVGVFATLSSALFTGALFEQLIAGEPPGQMDTMAELIASRLPVVDSWEWTDMATVGK